MSKILPFGHLFGNLGAQMPFLGTFWGSLKFHVFFGRILMLTLQRVPSSVKSTPKVRFFIRKYYSFPMCFALYAVCSRRYTHEKHIKKTLSSDSAGSNWLSLAHTRQVKFKEQITSSKYTEVIYSLNLTCRVSPSYSFH